MICLRCGWCCKKLTVIIVDDPAKGPAEDNLLEHTGFDGPCKHLRGDTPGQYSCALHDYSWYQDTPCATHTQIEASNSPCRLGTYTIKKSSKNVS